MRCRRGTRTSSLLLLHMLKSAVYLGRALYARLMVLPFGTSMINASHSINKLGCDQGNDQVSATGSEF
jgi:hypothetical protein